jgi:putative ABC transport system permease protein
MLLIAAVIAAPIAYLLNTTWLNFLAYHVSFGAGSIIIGVTIVFLIGVLTILSQTMKAANSNPVDVLKYE